MTVPFVALPPGSATYAHLTASGQVKAKVGSLQTLVINSSTAAVTVTIYDSLTATGTVIGIITTAAAPVSLEYGVQFNTGLYVSLSAAADVTVVYS